jgi:hypothetical protein
MRGYLGNQARNRQKGGHRNRGGGGPRHSQEGLPVDDHTGMDGPDGDIISPEELAASRSAMRRSRWASRTWPASASRT